jgi:hypothetical protein
MEDLTEVHQVLAALSHVLVAELADLALLVAVLVDQAVVAATVDHQVVFAITVAVVSTVKVGTEAAEQIMEWPALLEEEAAELQALVVVATPQQLVLEAIVLAMELKGLLVTILV